MNEQKEAKTKNESYWKKSKEEQEKESWHNINKVVASRKVSSFLPSLVRLFKISSTLRWKRRAPLARRVLEMQKKKKKNRTWTWTWERKHAPAINRTNSTTSHTSKSPISDTGAMSKKVKKWQVMTFCFVLYPKKWSMMFLRPPWLEGSRADAQPRVGTWWTWEM